MSSTTIRKATAALALAGALVGGGLGQASAQAADNNSSSIGCAYETIEPPLIADPPQYNYYAYSTGGDWNSVVMYSSGIDTWRLVNGQWSHTDLAGASYMVGQRMTLWNYSYVLSGGRWVAKGWTYLGTC